VTADASIAAMDAYRAIVDKRDQRAFLDRPLPEETLRRILQAGRMTGSSKNSEPNRFVVVRDRARVAALAGLSHFGRWLERAAVVVVIAQTEVHEFDAGRCAQNMMLAAWNDGVGSCPAHLPEPEVARLLGIPDGIAINRVIGFGYVDPRRAAPPASVARRRRPLEELVRYESWSRTEGTRLAPEDRREPG
jgi:nitroreductase